MQISKKDIFGGIIIGEAVAWLLFIMVRVNAPELPIPSGLATQLASFSTVLVFAIAFPLLSVLGLLVARVLSSIISILYQVSKFALVGALNTFVDLGILNALILFSDISSGMTFLVFKGLSFTVAVSNSYFWNKYWIFDSGETDAGKEVSQFLLVSIGGLVVNVGMAAVVVNVIGPQGNIAPAVWANIGALSATGLSLVWNFIGYKFWVFKSQN